MPVAEETGLVQVGEAVPVMVVVEMAEERLAHYVRPMIHWEVMEEEYPQIIMPALLPISETEFIWEAEVDQVSGRTTMLLMAELVEELF